MKLNRSRSTEVETIETVADNLEQREFVSVSETRRVHAMRAARKLRTGKKVDRLKVWEGSHEDA